MFFVPAVLPVTIMLKVHEAFDASVAPVKLMVPDPATAVIVPPPQPPMSPFGVETTSRGGTESVKPMPVSVGSVEIVDGEAERGRPVQRDAGVDATSRH